MSDEPMTEMEVAAVLAAADEVWEADCANWLEVAENAVIAGRARRQACGDSSAPYAGSPVVPLSESDAPMFTCEIKDGAITSVTICRDAPRPQAPEAAWTSVSSSAVDHTEATIPVTEEMIEAGLVIYYEDCPIQTDRDDLVAIYRAMAAVAPKEDQTALFDEWRAALSQARKETREAEHLGLQIAKEARAHIAALEAENELIREMLTDRDARIAELSDRRMVKADEAGSVPYHGPTRPVTDADGNVTGREAIPDEVHEQFHRAVGDVVSGNVIRPARDQMEKALADAKSKDATAPKSIRPVTTSGDPRRMGCTA